MNKYPAIVFACLLSLLILSGCSTLNPPPIPSVSSSNSESSEQQQSAEKNGSGSADEDDSRQGDSSTVQDEPSSKEDKKTVDALESRVEDYSDSEVKGFTSKVKPKLEKLGYEVSSDRLKDVVQAGKYACVALNAHFPETVVSTTLAAKTGVSREVASIVVGTAKADLC